MQAGADSHLSDIAINERRVRFWSEKAPIHSGPVTNMIGNRNDGARISSRLAVGSSPMIYPPARSLLKISA
jgi:hypothetical protein